MSNPFDPIPLHWGIVIVIVTLALGIIPSLPTAWVDPFLRKIGLRKGPRRR